MSSQKKLPSNRGRRQVKEITIETYPSTENAESASLLKPEGSKKNSKCKKAGNASKTAVATQPDEMTKSNVVDLRLEPITFVSDNKFVEFTKGILHLYKEECVHWFITKQDFNFILSQKNRFKDTESCYLCCKLLCNLWLYLFSILQHISNSCYHNV